MKRTLLFLLLVCMPFLSMMAAPSAFGRWHSDKYSMFIHFGLYSYYGGVWEGKPVTRGYSEQIQSHAGIYSDWYAEAAADFNAEKFDAREIAALARTAGMRSIVFTSKHHDGFCMFDTQTTDYNSVDKTPSGRDYVRELADACAGAGLKFGLYFSLIDWNFPHAYPISSHNADFITPQHHQLNLEQVRELLTSYGNISELWFDMGSLTPQQSRELYELVKSLQPDCMVSGRLGNDMYDFAVMPDNFYPDGSLQAPWQSAASMFNETWSWRSWQERGEVAGKAAQKLRSLIHVVSHGGNYLLNIGPMADGGVVPFERDVLMTMGKWLEEHSYAIYGTEASPFRDEFKWGNVTRKGNELYLMLSGEYPGEGRIVLHMPGCRFRGAVGADASARKGNVTVGISPEMYADPLDIKVITLRFDEEVLPFDNAVCSGSSIYMTADEAVKDYSYSCFDYYSNYKSTVAYGWTCNTASASALRLYHTSDESARSLNLDLSGDMRKLMLGDAPASLPEAEFTFGPASYMRMRAGNFIGPSKWTVYNDLAAMEVLDGDGINMHVAPFSNHLIVREMEVVEAGFALLELCSGNGVELVLDGRTFMKHLNPYGTERKVEHVLLYLEKGQHQIVLRSYNRFEDNLEAYVRKSPASLCQTEIPLERENRSRTLGVRISSDDRQSAHTDCGLHNLVVRIL